MRARLAIARAQISCELREVVLRDKPPCLLEYSPKATVPVLVLRDGTVIDESLDVMLWALDIEDPDGWLSPSAGTIEDMCELVAVNDHDFKTHLDRYKYADRYEDVDPLYHRGEAERFLSDLDRRIGAHGQLFGPQPSLADLAIGPFIRQFANTNRPWFDATPYDELKRWLEAFLADPLFTFVMGKYPQWHAGDEPTVFP